MADESFVSRSPTPPQDEKGRLPIFSTLKHLTRAQWLYLPRLFSRQEKISLIILALVAVAATGMLFTRAVFRITSVKPAVGGVLREGTLQEPRFINPLYASSDTDRGLEALVFSKLIRYDREGKPAMDLAENVIVSPDGKSYTVRLRPGVRWHDGKEFSVDDVIFTIKTIQDPEYQSPWRQNWQGVTIERLNEQTVRFSLRQPYAPFLENLAVGVLPEHLWRKIPRETANLSDLNLKPVGTGPYQFKKFTRREDGSITSIVLTRNTRYYREGPYIQEIRFSFYLSEVDLVSAYRRNEIDSFVFLTRLPLGELKRLDANISELRLPKIFGIFFNAGAAPALARKPVREALAMAIDRRALIEQAVASGSRLANSAIPPGALGSHRDLTALAYDVDGARRILAADGWKDSDRDGALVRTEGTGRNAETQRLEIRIMTSDGPELNDLANRIAEGWRAIGVKTEVEALPANDLETTAIRPRAYEALLFGEAVGHDPDPYAFWHTSQLKDPGLNIALYSNRAVDTLLEEARRTSDTAEREQKYREFQKIVNDDVGAIFLYSPVHFYATRMSLEGVDLGTITLPEERFNTITEWYMKTRRALK